jgi:hypothetical protein
MGVSRMLAAALVATAALAPAPAGAMSIWPWGGSKPAKGGEQGGFYGGKAGGGHGGNSGGHGGNKSGGSHQGGSGYHGHVSRWDGPGGAYDNKTSGGHEGGHKGRSSGGGYEASPSAETPSPEVSAGVSPATPPTDTGGAHSTSCSCLLGRARAEHCSG